MKTLLKILSSIIFITNSSLTYSQDENLIKFNGNNWTYGYKDSNGKIIVKPIYNIASVFNKGLALVWTDKGGTIINNKGEQLTEFGGELGTIYENLEYNLIRHKVNGKWGFINRKGEVIIEYQYSSSKDFNEGLAPIKINSKWGFIDSSNNLVISPQYDDVDLFYNGLAAIKINGKWGFIDKNGILILPAIYACVDHFSEELCAVNTFDFHDGNYICDFLNEVINAKGETIFKGQFHHFEEYKNGIASYWESYHFRGKHVFIDKKGIILKSE